MNLKIIPVCLFLFLGFPSFSVAQEEITAIDSIKQDIDSIKQNIADIRRILAGPIPTGGGETLKQYIARLKNKRLKSLENKEGFDPFQINVVGSGNIQGAVSELSNIPANTGVGTTITKYFDDQFNFTWAGMYKVNFEAIVNVASTAEPILVQTTEAGPAENVEDFGRSILAPLNSGQAVFLLMEGYRTMALGGLISGYELEFIGANRDWIYKGDTVRATTSAFRAGIFHDFVPFSPIENREEYAVTFGIAYALNTISNDIKLTDNTDILKKVLGTEKTAFHGIELSFDLKFKNVRAGFAYPILFSKDEDEIPGLTGGRVITSISFTGGFPIKQRLK